MVDQSADCDHSYLQKPQSHNDNAECHYTGSRKIPVVLTRRPSFATGYQGWSTSIDIGETNMVGTGVPGKEMVSAMLCNTPTQL